MSYALLVDEYRSKGGMDLMAALEQTREYAVDAPSGELRPQGVDAANQRALSELENMMRGVR